MISIKCCNSCIYFYTFWDGWSTDIVIVDIMGRVVAELANETWLAGRHTITWNADQFGSGVYFIHFTAGDYQQTQRIVLLK